MTLLSKCPLNDVYLIYNFIEHFFIKKLVLSKISEKEIISLNFYSFYFSVIFSLYVCKRINQKPLVQAHELLCTFCGRYIVHIKILQLSFTFLRKLYSRKKYIAVGTKANQSFDIRKKKFLLLNLSYCTVSIIQIAVQCTVFSIL